MILSAAQLHATAPSIYAPNAWGGVSKGYRFVPTIEVIGMMEDQGFRPVFACQSKSRIEGKGEFTKHMLRFRHVDTLATRSPEVPELVLVNSHDRTSAYKLYAGIFRMVCENGMVISSEDYGSFSLRHSGRLDLKQQVIETTGEVIGITRQAIANVEDWKGINLTRPQQLAFAAAASELKPNASIKPAHLLTARREADYTDGEGNRDLWRTMNTTQENMIRGGLSGRNDRGRKVTTKAVKSVSGDIAINRGLWRLAAEMAKLA